ncbi:hypothetical protein FQR65_LT05827 [Abscondita terminalis]|nr:hypothetical protein FQR65_LT05827 [Abscondita terminalis]
MVLKLYKFDASPPVRAVFLTAAALGLELELVDVDLLNKDQMNIEYIEKNPQHCVPTLDDCGTIVWDSHAINAYLVSKYGKNDLLYPKDIRKRANVDQRLHFDSCNLFPILRFTIRKVLEFGVEDGEDIMSKYYLTEYDKAFEILNSFLDKSKWVAGDNLTIADFSLISTVTSLECIVPLDFKKYPKIAEWIQRVQELPYYNVTAKGLKVLKEFLDDLMK